MKRLSRLLSQKNFPSEDNALAAGRVKALQLKMLRIQQGLWHSKKRAVIVFEGTDAAGKGGAIRRITETLDPRSLQVHPIGPPKRSEQAKHYLYRFWRDLPDAGMIAIFDRSWYGRVLVERVEKLTPEERWKQAYEEINQFEKMLLNDGIDLVKIFLAIHPEEQLRRFEARLRDPYKQWKLTDDDLEAHAQWKKYVKAGDDLLRLTHTGRAPWHLVPADSKEYARNEVLKIVTRSLRHHANWIESVAQKKKVHGLRHALKKIEKAAR